MFLVAGLLAAVPAEAVEPSGVLVSSETRIEFTPSAVVTLEDQIIQVMLQLGRTTEDAECAFTIFRHESGIRLDVRGDSGRSYGLGQRFAPVHGVPPDPWPVADQVVWFDQYAQGRYGSWCQAEARWLARAADRGGAGWW